MSDLIERLEAWIPGCGAEAPMSMEADLRQAVKALEAADAWVDAVLQHRGETAAFDAYVSARATSTKEDG